MVKYQLVYFNLKGRAEVCRLLFAQAGVEYEDKRISYTEEWPALKSKTPTGQLPYLVIDETVILTQSHAIARYLARQYSMYGDTILEGAQIDSLSDTICEFVDAVIALRYAAPESKALMKKKMEDKASWTFKHVNEALSESSSGWLVGNKVSVVDLVAYHMFTNFRGHEDFIKVEAELNGYEKIMAHQEKVAALPKIKKWLATRPVTDH